MGAVLSEAGVGLEHLFIGKSLKAGKGNLFLVSLGKNFKTAFQHVVIQVV